MRICEGCDEEKNISEFSKGNKKCKKCYCEHVKNHYKVNGRSFQRTKTKLKEGKCCEICGRKDFLEFDHINREEKSFTIGQNQSSKRIINEASKCRIVCRWCHRLVTRKFNDVEQTKRIEKIKNFAENTPVDKNGKKCNGQFCQEKQISNVLFYKNKKGNPTGKCKRCISYEDYLASKKRQEYINQIKRKLGECEQCQTKVEIGNEPCFDFDHLNPSTKLFGIGRYISCRMPQMRVDLEIAKCRLLCCMCHFTHTNSTKVYHKKRKVI